MAIFVKSNCPLTYSFTDKNYIFRYKENNLIKRCTSRDNCQYYYKLFLHFF